MASLFAQFDAQLDQLFAGWNLWSTTLTVVLFGVLFSPLFFSSEPDIHPFLLSRQGGTSPVRNSGESAVYRSIDTAHRGRLRTGLEVKDGASQWATRDGDLRDIWLAAIKSGSGKSVRILNLRGNNTPTQSAFEELSKQINIIGKHVSSHGGKQVVIYLPNSAEFLVSLFACAFYNIVPVLIPTNIPLEQLADVVRQTSADSIIASAGVVSEDDLAKILPSAKVAILVVQNTSQQMDFAGETSNGKVNVWHKIVKGQAPTQLSNDSSNVPNVISLWQSSDESPRLIEYTQANIISAVAAQLSVLPKMHAFNDRDTMVSLESLTQTFPLAVTLAALYSGVSLALTSAASSTADYALAFQGNLKPTIVLASSATIAKLHARSVQENQGFFQKIHKSRQASYLASGTMRALDQQSPRLIYISESPDSIPLSAQDLNDVRILNGSRIIRALVIPEVTAAVAETHILDYRISPSGTKRAHFGSVVSSLEAKVVDPNMSDEDYQPVGQLVVSGPAVLGKGEVKTNLRVKFNEDYTLQLA